MPYWRTTRDTLHADSRVCFPAEYTWQESKIEPGTKGVVTAVPDDGDVTVRIVGGKHEGVLVAVSPGLLAHGGITAVSTSSGGRWNGKVVEVVPGIGVEVLTAENDGYPAFVWRQLEQIMTTAAGKAIVATFDAGRKQDFEYRAGRPFHGAPYEGLTLLIGQPRPLFTAPPPTKRVVYPQIRTMDVGVRTADWQRDTKGDRIPRIEFFDQPGQADQPVEIGKAGGATVRHEGVRGHRDFPDTVQAFDLVLYHELVHAYLSNNGVSGRIRDVRVEAAIAAQNHDEAEEELVVGLLAGRGLPLCENAYRLQRQQPLRTSYLDSHLDDPGVSAADWNAATPLTAAVTRWENTRHLDPKDARWLATGKDG